MTRVEKTVFLSYRRTNVPWALAIAQNLTHNGFDVFLDYQGIATGDFEQVILENIRARAHFLILLTPSALECCDQPGDWFRREIEEALETRRNVVPLMLEGFAFHTQTIASKLTGKLEVLKRYNGMTVPAEYFDAAMTKLRDKFLNVSLEAVLHPASELAQQAAKVQQAAAAAAPPVQQRELTAQEWFERGFNADDPDEAIRCYTAALQLQPDYAKAYNNRGVAHANKSDHNEAINDYTEALRLQPDLVSAYINRGLAHDSKRDFDGAINDYTQALRLQPDLASVYTDRGLARAMQGDTTEAIADHTEALRLNPDYAAAYTNRGIARAMQGDLAGAIADYTEALRLEPDDAAAYTNWGLARATQGDLVGAIADYTEALQLNPDSTEVYFNRGCAFLAKGDMRAAQEDFDKAKLLKNQH